MKKQGNEGTRQVTVNLDDPIHVLMEEVRAIAIRRQLPEPEELAKALAERIRYRLGGCYLYVSSGAELRRSEVHAQIRQRWNGKNARQLALEYGYSVRHVARIVAA